MKITKIINSHAFTKDRPKDKQKAIEKLKKKSKDTVDKTRQERDSNIIGWA
jgi:hypothetical protein